MLVDGDIRHDDIDMVTMMCVDRIENAYKQVTGKEIELNPKVLDIEVGVGLDLNSKMQVIQVIAEYDPAGVCAKCGACR
ncbi:hypothetical protein [Anaeroselena agilis]|uniref:Uncharacterized protein n=1 Tax=Anaeroselena agilis TaxID=3063788 RepID=A0ABU3NVU3_9FIRM|nr:hypothetical protein [Selenomonadales bacterium 4137-cl]